MTLITLIFGFLFGVILQYAKLNKYNTISGMAMLTDYTMAKAIAAAIGVGIILLNIEIGLGFASYHIKPFMFGGVVLGGLIFGIGMAILGYCPGTLAISFGEGSLDALLGIIGGLLGGLTYTLLLPSIHEILGPNLGKISLYSLVGANSIIFYLLVIIIGVGFIWVAFWLHKIEKVKDMKWLYAGIALAVLEFLVFLSFTTDRAIGASTAYPYLADLLTGTTENSYFEKIQKSGNWGLIFLTGTFISGLLLSLIRKDFKITLIHENWKKYRGDSNSQRVIWAFVGGFILIFGARMAGGCTSGHILSGGMQLAISSLTFAVFTFIGFLVTGKVFYLNKK